MELRLIEEARRRYGDKALAFFGCRQEGLGEGVCEQDILVYPSSETGSYLKIKDEVYEFVPISDPRSILLEKRGIVPFYDPYMLLHSVLTNDERRAWRDSVIYEVELGIKDLIYSLYFNDSPTFLARAGIRLARARLLLRGIVPRPTHLFHQLRKHSPRVLYRLRELWGLDTAPMEKLDISRLRRLVPEVHYEITAQKLRRLYSDQEDISAKLLFLTFLASVNVKEDEKDPLGKPSSIPVLGSPKEWREWLKEEFHEILQDLKP